MLHTGKKRKFELLIENVGRCNLCRRMCGRTKVLSEKNGNIESRIVFIGEAPGRLGADRTGIPFSGDNAGKNFEKLLQFAELTRKDIFITNAVLCNPRDENGNNSAPNKQEIKNCSTYLSILINIIEPEFIVSLGQSALNALHIINAHQIKLRQNVRTLAEWGKYTVIPLYHPGSRAIIYRNVKAQQEDFSFLNEIIWQKDSLKVSRKQDYSLSSCDQS